jgi:hypothetical protein
MNVSINCKISLSKKLRAILESDATITVVSQDIKDGKGTAILSLNSENIKDFKIEDLGETAIMLAPVEFAIESPNESSPVHSSIFTSNSDNKPIKNSPINKLAATVAPERGNVSRAYNQVVEVPEAFKQYEDPKCVEYIKDMDQLIQAVNVAKNKKSEVDPETASNDRQRAILAEMKEKEEAIDVPAWIVNEKYGMMTINDLNISLKLNAPYDLSNLSAKKIASSKDLRGAIKSGAVRIISPDERDQLAISSLENPESIGGLEAFGSVDEAMGNMESRRPSSRNPVINDNEAIEISESDLDQPSEDESMIINLTQSAPRVKPKPTMTEEGRKTVHGNTNTEAPIRQQRPLPTNKPAIKPIGKLF